MATNIIPFGKYKGQPIEVLQQDKQYLEWLQSQDWFKERYQNINTIIINNFSEPSETPEHNKLQNLFLDKEVCKKFFEFQRGLGRINLREKVVYIENVDEINKAIKFNQSHAKSQGIEYEPNAWISDHWLEQYGLMKIPKKIEVQTTAEIKYEITRAIFEEKGIDVYFSLFYDDDYFQKYHAHLRHELRVLKTFFIEIKPVVGDDYPAILRKMNSGAENILIADKFTAVGATIEQVKEIFSRSNKQFYLFSEFL